MPSRVETWYFGGTPAIGDCDRSIGVVTAALERFKSSDSLAVDVDITVEPPFNATTDKFRVLERLLRAPNDNGAHDLCQGYIGQTFVKDFLKDYDTHPAQNTFAILAVATVTDADAAHAVTRAVKRAKLAVDARTRSYCNTPVGYALLTTRERVAKLQLICGGIRGVGLGDMLMDACEQFCLDNRIDILELDSVVENVNFYSNRGFVPTGILKENGGLPELHEMSKPLVFPGVRRGGHTGPKTRSKQRRPQQRKWSKPSLL
jgi:GNAT superfamily N-acetyltransferase